MQQTALEQWQNLYDRTFDQLYLYFARRVRTKRIAAFLMESVYRRLAEELASGGQHFGLLDLYKWAWELLSVELEKIYGQQKTHEKPVHRIEYFDDVYRLKKRESDAKAQSKDRTFDRPVQLDIFYGHLSPTEREVLWLTAFESLSDLDRAYVLGVPESDATRIFYESLKKAKDILDQATAHQKMPPRYVPYFGNVLALLQKSREEEALEIDQELKKNLRNAFAESSAQLAAQAKAESVTASEEDASTDWNRIEGPFSIWDVLKRFQAVFVLVFVSVVVAGLYFGLYSQAAQVNRLLRNNHVSFAPDFTEDEKKDFARDALLYLTKRRDFVSVSVQKLDGKRIVYFDLQNGLKEQFYIHPHAEPWAWQTKDYVQIATL